MEQLLDFFGKKDKQNKLKIDKDTSSKDLDTLRLYDYNRSQFDYNFMSNIGWNPDEILEFAEINRISYVEFRQIFDNKSNMFDKAIRNAIYFMNQDPYCNDSDIKQFISHRTTDISDNYWNRVVEEDNCFMDGLENRKRSNHEQQHYYLLKALSKLIKYKNIRTDEVKIKHEYIKNIKIFISIYHLKNAYSMIDDVMRNILYACINKISIAIYLPKIFFDMYNEIDDNILSHANSTEDVDLINRAYLFKDILSYALYKTTQFAFVYNTYDDFILLNELSDFKDNYITPFGKSKYKKIFSQEDITRIEYVYLNYHNKLINKNKKDKLIIQNIDFEKLMEKNEDFSNRPRIMTPKYSSKNRMPFDTSDYPVFYIKNHEKKNSATNILRRETHKRSKSSTSLHK
jgi:hypothetical protein